MPKGLQPFLFKSTVPIIPVEIVILMKVIRNVEIGPTITIIIKNHYTKSISQTAGKNT